jgi:hypothetical protein
MRSVDIGPGRWLTSCTYGGTFRIDRSTASGKLALRPTSVSQTGGRVAVELVSNGAR